MFKLIGFLMILGGCTGISLYIVERNSMRIRLLEEWEEVLFYLQGEISYSASSLTELIYRLSFGKRVMKPFWKEMERALYEKEGGSFGEIWKKTLDADAMTGYLKEKEKEILYSIGRNLGQTDRDTQLHTIQVFQKRLHHILEIAQTEFRQKQKVCMVVGITAGLMLGILLL